MHCPQTRVMTEAKLGAITGGVKSFTDSIAAAVRISALCHFLT
jgi:hypothetical protein